MHACNTFRNVGEYVQNLGLGQAMLQAGIHEVDEPATIAVFHEEEDLVAPTSQFGRVGVDICDNRSVPLEALHRLDLNAHAPQRLFVGHSDPLEHSEVGTIDGLRKLDQVDVREATLGQVFLDDDPVAADLDLGARRECAGRDDDARGSGHVGTMASLRGVSRAGMGGRLVSVRGHFDAARAISSARVLDLVSTHWPVSRWRRCDVASGAGLEAFVKMIEVIGVLDSQGIGGSVERESRIKRDTWW